LLKLGWAFVTQVRVFTDGVVERFDVFEQAQADLRLGLILVVDQLYLQSAQERLHRGVIPAVPFATHAALKTIAVE
ncbi:MAG: hypothetical protein KDA66_10210, partial [Planctomycetaceae bacterium]|nr:hypothetical protein [Planctomycetaceae bacterium]